MTPPSPDNVPHIDNPAGIDLGSAGEAILRAMFPRHARLVIDAELSGGFSGSLLLQVVPHRAGGVTELPAVVKLGPTGLIRDEASAYHSLIRGRLSGIPEVWGDPIPSPDGSWSGLRYAKVGNGLFTFESLVHFFRHAPLNDLWQVVENRLFVHMSSLWEETSPLERRRGSDDFDRILPVNAVVRPVAAKDGPGATTIRPDRLPGAPLRLGEAVVIEGLSVVEIDPKGQTVTLDVSRNGGTPGLPAPGYRLRLSPLVDSQAWVVGQAMPRPIHGTVVDTRHAILLHRLQAALADNLDLTATQLRRPFFGQRSLPNPLVELAGILTVERPVRVATIHGDLNLDNVLVDTEARTVHIVDFALSRDDHVLHDLWQLEVGVVTRILPELLAATELPAEAAGVVLESALAGQSEAVSHPTLNRALLLLTLIHKRAASLFFEPGDWSEYLDGLTAYLLGAIRYRNLDAAAQRVAFWAAAMARSMSLESTVPITTAEQFQPVLDRLLAATDLGASRWRLATRRLPTPATALIGRGPEVDRVIVMLGAGRLVTLVGPGGVGKTRLALEVAGQLAERLADGAWFIDLVQARTGEEMDRLVAAALGVAEPPGDSLRKAVIGHLADKVALLVLDNCEQAIAPAADLVETFLGRCPGLTCLVTSREALQLPSEQVWTLDPLEVPDAMLVDAPRRLMDSPSVALFVERLRSLRPGFSVTSANASAVVRICRDLDGLPLALELAAARGRVLTVDQIAARLGDQLRFFRQEGRVATPHHRTLEATVDWSYALLTPAERSLFTRLAVFVGGFTLEAAAAICADPAPAAEARPVAAYDLLDGVVSLAEKSLVVAPDDAARIPRFRLLAPIRAFALDRLGAGDTAAAITERHATWFTAWAEEAAKHLSGSGQANWLNQMDGEHGNLDAALQHMIHAANRAGALSLVTSLSRYWLIRGRFAEGRDGCRRTLGLFFSPTDSAPLAKLHGIEGDLALQQGDFGAARAAFESAWRQSETIGDRRTAAETLRRLGKLADLQGQTGEAERFMQASLDHYTALDDGWGIAAVLNNLGLLASNAGHFDLARERLVESLIRFRSLEERWAEGVTLLNLGNVAYDSQDFEDAEEFYAKSLEIARELGDQVGIASAQRALGNVAAEGGDFIGARRRFAESLTLSRGLDDRKSIVELLESLAAVQAMDDRPAEAVRLYTAARALRTAIGFPLPEKESSKRSAELDGLCASLGHSAYEREQRRGASLPWSEIADWVLAEMGDGA